MPGTYYFSSDYSTARTRFREMVQAAAGRLHVLDLEAQGPAGEHLSIDIGWFGAQHPNKVLLHSSGLHGVEGFAGSAIQLQILKTLPDLQTDSSLILVHVLNPYGMTWLRRVNENNVDLNRNFLRDDEYSGAPDGYAPINLLLNPASPSSTDFYILQDARLIPRHGMPKLRQAIAGGQYEYPKGLFFGGKRREAGPCKYLAFLRERLISVRHVITIDVHTGLGKYGEDTLLVHKDYEALQRIFGRRIAPSEPDKGPAYRIRGGLNGASSAALPEVELSFITQEFGTYGGARVLHALREENRWHHYGDGALDHSSKRRLKKTFCPDDDAWRSQILQRGQEMAQDALAVLEAGV